MNLTNDQAEGCPTEESTSFSKYFGSEDHDEDEYNYSESNINDTLLLEATLLDSKPDLVQHCTTPLLNHLKEEQGSISREKSLVFDLCGDLSISESQLGSCTDGPPEKSNQKISDLYNICTKLVNTISKLENKVERIEEKEGKQGSSREMERDESRSSLEKEVQSRLTYSSLQNSKGCKCEGQINQKDIISGLFQALQSKPTVPSYGSYKEENSFRQENEMMKKQIVRLEIGNQELRKTAKRTETENVRLRQLLRQYHNFNKKLIVEKKEDDRSNLSRKYSQKLLSDRNYNHRKTSTTCFQDYQQTRPSEHQAGNGGEYYEDLTYQEEPRREIETPASARNTFTYSPMNKRKVYDGPIFEPKIVFEPQASRKLSTRVAPRQTEPTSIKIMSFQQCRAIEQTVGSSSPFRHRMDVLKPIGDANSKTFRDLKQTSKENNPRY